MEVLVSRVRSVLDGQPVTARRMFGGLTFLLNGNMLCCISQKGLMVRVGAKAEPAALDRPYAAPCLGAGRRMAGFILVERAGLTTDAELAVWLDMALAYVADLPAKHRSLQVAPDRMESQSQPRGEGMSVLNVHPILFVIFETTTILLSLKALFLGAATASARGKLKTFLNAEDAAWLGGVHKNPDPEVVARLGRAHRNDLENLLPFFICGLLYVLSEGPAIAGYVYCGAFLISRVAHTGAYLGARPMLRRNAYTLGFLTIAIMGAHAAWLMAQRLVG